MLSPSPKSSALCFTFRPARSAAVYPPCAPSSSLSAPAAAAAAARFFAAVAAAVRRAAASSALRATSDTRCRSTQFCMSSSLPASPNPFTAKKPSCATCRFFSLWLATKAWARSFCSCWRLASRWRRDSSSFAFGASIDRGFMPREIRSLLLSSMFMDTASPSAGPSSSSRERLSGRSLMVASFKDLQSLLGLFFDAAPEHSVCL
mmetsp:Transcript_5514/g.9578  ORF Transcript_5514/g.9578 Transcript_5514/m.9578 type:complete len:205 (+) Transcript_5514:2374-2988(+)